MGKTTNKVALVTGGSTGIGAAIALKLAEQRYQVVITGRNEKTLKKSAVRHDNLYYFLADVSRTNDVKITLNFVQERFNRLNVLVNNAGIAPMVPFEDMALKDIDMVFKTNFRGVVDTIQQALPLLKESRGNIINISSVAGDRPVPGFSIYSASKGALNTLTYVLAKELAEYGVRVNSISPGPIETSLFEKIGLSDTEMDHMSEAIRKMVPLARFGDVNEVAEIVAFLASDKANYITGAQYKVDGGFSV